MRKGFEIGRNVMAIYGTVSLFVGIIAGVKLKKDLDALTDEGKKEEPVVEKKGGKTYFKVQKDNENHQTMGFHLS